MIIFETERLLIRRFTEDDGDNYFLLNGDEEVMRYIRPARNREESDEQLRQILQEYAAYPMSRTGRWGVVEKATGRFIGSFVIIPIPSEPEKTQLGYSFIPEYWGKGLATEAATAGLKYFLENTNIPEIYGVAETPNIASQKVLQKAGFVFHSTKTEEGRYLVVFIVKR
ncbi:MAG: GNAT family N-acetyltransferase [Chitinophagaceae bacterium]